MSDESTIRPMTVGNFDAFNRLHSFEETITNEGFKQRVEKGGFFGLFLLDVLLGYMNLNLFSEDEGHFQSIFIGEEHRGKGYSNILMKYAIKWYLEQGAKRVHLYTEVDNEIAQGLYRKHGYEIDSRAWHFIVPFSTLKPKIRYTCHEVMEDEIDLVGKLSHRLPAGEIRRWMGSDSRRVLALKDDQGDVKGACLFAPSFPGCRPFVISHPDCFDDFIIGIKKRSLPEFDYVRIVFSGNDNLAEICKERGYELFDEMFYFTMELVR
ncbi:MAG: GNAT family N-acetyltransferase [Candidatus Thorarchaeota archaeon]